MAASTASLPSPSIDWSASDLDTAMRKFLRACQLHFDGPLHDVSETVKVNYLLLWSGSTGQDIADTFEIAEEDEGKLAPYIAGFASYAKPRSNFRVARFRLLGSAQQPGESVDSYVKNLRQLLAQCDYEMEERETILVDVFIFGLHLKSVQSSLLKEGKALTIDEALRVARTEEATRQHVDIIRGGNREDRTVDRIQAITPRRQQKKFEPPSRQCGNCGRQHEYGCCPAKGQTCKACGKTGHWQRVCRSRKRQSSALPRAAKVNELRNEQNGTTEVYFDTVDVDSAHITENSTQAFAQLTFISGSKRINLKCKVDTGAEGNVMPISTYRRLSADIDTPLTSSTSRIFAYGGATVRHLGITSFNIQHNGKESTASFFVTDTAGPVLIGLPTCRDLELVSFHFSVKLSALDDLPSMTASPRSTGDEQFRQRILSEYADVFDGIGCFDEKVKVFVDPSVPPVIHPPRRVPVSLKEKFKRELDTLTEQGIISPVTHPTDWVNSCVCVTKKNGQLRLCLDPRDLNRAVKRPHYVTPTLDDILDKLHGAKWFSMLDARSGYWNLKLDKESADLTTFNTSWGRYRFDRLPMGLSCAQDEFQRAIDRTFGDIPNVLGIADDLVVVGFQEDGRDHDKALKTVLRRARERGPRFNEDKLIVRAKEIPFFGHIIGSGGIRPDPVKTDAIRNMEPPRNEKELQSFLGMVNYLNRFSSRLASLTSPLRELLKRDSVYRWGPEFQRALDDVKKEIAQTATLRYYDPHKQLILQVDASSIGLGAALIQENGPIAFASKALTDTESRYSNIEREMLGIVFGLERFHHYVYGRPVIVHTDHKPLEAIAKKNLANAPPRLTRMLLRAQRYDFNVIYRPGKEVPVADALSRISPCDGDEIKDIDVAVHLMDNQLHASPTCLSDIRRETARDSELNAVAEAVLNGWPTQRSDCPSSILPYWNYRDELGLQDGLLLKGSRIVIPATLKTRILSQLHAAHQGMEKTKLLSRGSVFWVGINGDIENMIARCATCQRHQPAQQREPLHPHDVAPCAWHTLAADLFHWENKTFLLIGDTLAFLLFGSCPPLRRRL